MAREGQGYPCYQHDMMVMMIASPMACEIWIQSQVESYQRLKKMVLDTTLLNTQHYKVRIKSKVEQSREKSSDLPYTLVL